MYDVCMTEDFSFRVEIDEYCQVNLHLDVHIWTPRVARLIKNLFEEAKEAFRIEGFSKIYAITSNINFINRMLIGGEDLGEIATELGYRHVVFWDLEV